MVSIVHAINFSFGVDVYRRQLNTVGSQIRCHIGPVILGGDFNAWSNRQNQRERIKGDMYFVGVRDATEGILWCPDRPLKPGSLRSIAYDYFSKSSPERLKNAQAKTLIIEALKEIYACK